MNHENHPYPNLSELEKIIGYTFNDKHLGLRAITTRAYSRAHPHLPDNQALEFLGDAVLSLVTAELLYEKWPELKDSEALSDKTPEGVMTKIRQEVVNNQYLTECAIEYNLCQKIYDKNAHDPAISSACHGDDIIEALIAAIYLDSKRDITPAKTFILQFLDLPNLLNDEKGLLAMVTTKNPKDKIIHKLQELMKVNPTIDYPVIEDRLNKIDNTHHFVLGIRIDDKLLPGITGEGKNKLEAQYKAADKAYQLLEDMEWDFSKINRVIVETNNFK
jgi:ribonuclease-3